MDFPAPAGPIALYAATAGLVVLAGVPGAVATGALVCLPLWFFLFLLHVVLRGGDGLHAALAQGARLGAIASASAALLRAFRPLRFLDAMAARGRSFHSAYLVVATLQSLPRLRARAHAIQEAQLPPMPDDLAATLPPEGMDVDIPFTIFSNR